MTDKYIQKQLQNYETAPNEKAADNALYRLGTYLEVIKCDGNDKLTDEQRQTILDTTRGTNG